MPGNTADGGGLVDGDQVISELLSLMEDPARSFYEVLAVPDSTEDDSVYEKAYQERKRILLRYRANPKVADRYMLLDRELGQAFSALRDQASRTSYDAELRERRNQAALQHLDLLFPLAAVQGAITPSTVALLELEVVDLGIDPGESADLVARFLADRDVRIVERKKTDPAWAFGRLCDLSILERGFGYPHYPGLTGAASEFGLPLVEAALVLGERIAKAAGDRPEAEQAYPADHIHRKVEALVSERRFEDGVKWISAAIGQWPSQPEPYHFRAGFKQELLASRRVDVADALADATVATRLGPERAQYHLTQGDLLMRAGDHFLAERAYRAARRARAGGAGLQTAAVKRASLARTAANFEEGMHRLIAQENWEKLAAWAQEFLQRQPDAPSAFYAYALASRRMLQGRVFTSGTAAASAVSAIDRAIQLAPENEEYKSERARLLARIEELDGVVSGLQRLEEWHG